MKKSFHLIITFINSHVCVVIFNLLFIAILAPKISITVLNLKNTTSLITACASRDLYHLCRTVGLSESKGKPHSSFSNSTWLIFLPLNNLPRTHLSLPLLFSFSLHLPTSPTPQSRPCCAEIRPWLPAEKHER